MINPSGYDSLFVTNFSVRENIKVALQNKSVKIFPGLYIVLLLTTYLFYLNATIRYKKITC